MAMEGPEFERAFRGAIHYALNSGFSEILELRPVQEEALLHLIKSEDVFAVLPTGWMRQIFDISACAESLFVFA